MTDPALGFCFNHSIGSFLNYVTKSIIVVNKESTVSGRISMSMSSRSESFRVLFSVIRDYIRDFPYYEEHVNCIEEALSKVDLPSKVGDIKFVETITKEWRRRVNPINSFPESSVYGYWPAETSPDIIKTRFSSKFSTNRYVPVDLDFDAGEFWKDVQKFCALTTIDQSGAVILSYPTIMTARTVIKGKEMARLTCI